MLERERAAWLAFAWITGDSVYGAEHAIQAFAERHGIGSVLAVTTGRRVGMCPVAERFADQAAALSEDASEDASPVRQRRSAGEGAEGPRL